MGTYSEPFHVQIGLPFLIAKQAALASRAPRSTLLLGSSQHHDVRVDAPGLAWTRVEHVPYTENLGVILWRRLPQQLHKLPRHEFAGLIHVIPSPYTWNARSSQAKARSGSPRAAYTMAIQ